jgi:FKBP-type peptidyl-prolyl cis-trans isomerase
MVGGCRSGKATTSGGPTTDPSVPPASASASAVPLENAPIATPPPTAKTLADGIRYEVLRAPSSDRAPHADSVVAVAYAAYKADGVMLDSTYDGRYGPDSRYGGAAFKVPVRELTSGLATAVLSLKEGEKRRFWIPWEQARGKGAHRLRPILDPPYGLLTIDLELVEIH